MLRKINVIAMVLFLVSFVTLACNAMFGWTGNSEETSTLSLIILITCTVSFLTVFVTAIIGGFGKK